MTTNQTIDGVPRELRALLERVVGKASQTPHWDALDEDRIAATAELRALLDGPQVESELSRMTRRCQNAELALKVQTENYEALKAAQPRGGPVTWTEVDVLDFMSVALRHAEYSGLAPSDILDGLRYMAEKGKPAFYRADQPAPVAVVLPERMSLEKPEHHTAPVEIHNGVVTGWNACLDEVTRLNTK